jgi:hypothetical protein
MRFASQMNHGQPLRLLARFGLATLACGTVAAHAATVPIFNSGVSTSGTLLAAGAADPHWKIVAGPGITTPVAPLVLSNAAASPYPQATDAKWVWLTSTGYGAVANKVYTFEQTFDLTGYDPSTAVLSGKWAIDNSGSLKLNGATPVGTGGLSVNSYNPLVPFTLTGGFVSGINKLDFLVIDAGEPGGWAVSGLTLTAAPIPEPSTLEMTLSGVVLLVAMRKRLRTI